MKSEMWNRVLWGVRFTGVDGRSFLIGAAWSKAANEANKGYPDEPMRALLFRTRKFARAFCADKRKQARETGGVCAKWRYTPIRVREIVRATVNGDGKR